MSAVRFIWRAPIGRRARRQWIFVCSMWSRRRRSAAESCGRNYIATSLTNPGGGSRPYAADRAALPRYVDRYRGLEILMPLANWVSAKTHTFDSTGYEIA